MSVTFVRSGIEDAVLDGEDVRWIATSLSAEEDATATLQVVGPTPPEVVIVDHYALDCAWERVVAASGASVVAIDDLADRDHVGDLLIDHNPLPAERYDGRVPDATRRLIGPRYALLRPEGPSPDDDRRPRELRDEVTRLLVGFGGGAALGPIALALDTLSDPRLSHLSVDLVVGSDHRVEEVQRTIRPDRGTVRVHGWVSDLEPMMRAADVVLGAGGVSVLERLRLGLPAVVVTIADNQEASCRALHQAGLLVHAGRFGETGPEALAEALLDLLQDVDARRHVAERGPDLVDGLGAERCAAAIADLVATTPRHSDG